MNFPLVATDSLTTQITNSGIRDWDSLLTHIQNLPYGRNGNRNDLSLVISEEKGSCSSKHALLKKVADQNKVPGVRLILGMYKMNADNTPGIGSLLAQNTLAFVPEAHCYLKIDGKRIDVTNPHSNFKKIESDLIEEQEITPEEVVLFKVIYHKKYLVSWLQKSGSNLSFSEVWAIREQCIHNLSNNLS
jgi:hypothetical protein